MAFLLSLSLRVLAIYLTARFLPGVLLADFTTAIMVTIVFSLVNLLIKPFLFILTLPINILTLGLFTFALNAFMVLLTAWLVPGFQIPNFTTALLFSLILAIINYFFQYLTK